MGRRAKVAVQSTLLLVGSLVLTLLLCEGMARLYAPVNVDHSRSAVGNSSADLKNFATSDLAARSSLADRFVPSIAVADGVNAKWFDDLPEAPVRDPNDVDPRDEALSAEYIKRGHFGPQSFYIWNEQFVKARACTENDELFDNLPAPVKVFQPADDNPHPIYRFPPNWTLPSGLKTNRYGFRGPDFPPERSPDAIRIAFVGSSETVGDHGFPFSFPEYFGIWLGKWLLASGYPFRVEIINAGREGIGTADVAAILKEEVLPLAPDYIIFYDGANQLAGAQSFAGPDSNFQRYTLKELLGGQGLLPKALTARSRFAEILDDTYRLYLDPLLDDWRRPKHEFRFPDGIDETAPDIDSAKLPLGLVGFLRDLKSMTDATRAAGRPFAISTLVWLDGSELAFANPNQASIRALLKAMFWPLRPAEIRRLIDFSNRTLRKFAKANDLGLLDIAKEFPRDPDLFTDAYHMKPDGLKLLAWIGLQQFLPRLAEDLREDRLGKTQSVIFQGRSSGEEFAIRCRPSAEEMATAREMPATMLTRVSEAVSLEQRQSGMAFRSATEAGSQVGQMPLLASCIAGGGWVAADLRVTHGTARLGVLNRIGDDYLATGSAAAGEHTQTVFLRLDFLPPQATWCCETGKTDLPRRASCKPSGLSLGPDQLLQNAILIPCSPKRCRRHTLYRSRR